MVPPPPPQGQQPPPAPAPYTGTPQPPYGAQPPNPYSPPAPPAPAPYGAPNQQQPYGAPNQPYGSYAPQPYPMQPAKSGGIGKVLLIIAGVIVGLFALLLVIASFLPDDAGSDIPVAGEMGILSGPVMTDQVNPTTQAPVGSPKVTLAPTTDQIFAAIRINVNAGSELGAKWYYEGMHQAHLDTLLPVDKDYNGWASFNIGNAGDPWPTGSYKVEVYLDGAKQAETIFSVR